MACPHGIFAACHSWAWVENPAEAILLAGLCGASFPEMVETQCTVVCSRQGFAAREAAMDQIRLREARPDCPTGVTVLGGSMFFKDTDRVLKTMRRRGTASAFGDGFARRYNPIHGADLAARCCAFASVVTRYCD